MNNMIDDISKAIIPVFKKYGINSASIVGSFAKKDYIKESDIDIVVEITYPISLLTFARIKNELENILNRRVDLIERSAIKSRLKKSLLRDKITLDL